MGGWVRVVGSKNGRVIVEVNGFSTRAQAGRSFFLVKDSKGLRRVRGFKRSRKFIVENGTLIQRVYVTGSYKRWPSETVEITSEGINVRKDINLLEEWELEKELEEL